MSGFAPRVATALVGLACVACLLGAAPQPAAAAIARGARTASPVPAAPALQVRAAALYVPATGQTLYADAADAERPVASTTKLMTALVVLQHVHRLSTVFTYPDYHQAADDSQIGLRPGDRMTVHDLFIAMLLPSADDAAEDLAYNVGHGSVARFVSWMNADARRLGLTHTHYSTPIGLDTPGNHSSASDLVRLAAYDLAHYPFFAKVVNMPSAELSTGPVREVDNLNLLLDRYPWVTGVKTGHTSGAGYVLVASGQRDGMRLIGAVLGTTSDAARDDNGLALLDWGYANFRMFRPVHAQQALARLAVKDRPGLRVPVRAARSFRWVLARSSDVRLRVQVPHRLAGPLPAGTVVGSAAVLAGHQTLARIPVVLERRLPAVSNLAIAGRYLGDRPWLIAVFALLLAAVLVALVRVARRGAGGRPPGGGRLPGVGAARRAGSSWGRA